MTNKTNGFDILRLLAACLVLFSHCFPLSGHKSSEPFIGSTPYGTFGELAVDMFFVISGYLVTGSYLRGNGVVEFVIKRALRILPAFWVVILVTVFLLGPAISTIPVDKYFVDGQTMKYLRNMFFYINFYLPGLFESNPYPRAVNGSLWTLPMEIFMYFMVLLLGVLKILKVWWVIGVAGIFVFLHFVVPSSLFSQNGVVFYQMPYADLTRLGCLYFSGAALWFAPRRIYSWYGIAGLPLLIYMASFNGAIMQVFSWLYLAYLTITLSHSKIFSSEKLKLPGDYSYGVYIYAFPIQQVCMMYLGPDASPYELLVFSLPLTAIFAVMSWVYIEKPALRWKHHLPRFDFLRI